MSGSEPESEDMPVRLNQVKTLVELYKSAVLRAAESPRHPANTSLLERVSLWQGDITQLEVDSIVNAANKRLLGGGGVDGAIHFAAGRGLLEECPRINLVPGRTLNGCETGDSKITKGKPSYNLPSRHVIHTVGPVYAESKVDLKASQLASCYRRSLELAVENSLRHIAFPSISTGVYGYPIDDATHIALAEVRKFLDDDRARELERVIFVVWSDKDKGVYEELLPEYFPEPEMESAESGPGAPVVPKEPSTSEPSTT